MELTIDDQSESLDNVFATSPIRGSVYVTVGSMLPDVRLLFECLRFADGDCTNLESTLQAIATLCSNSEKACEEFVDCGVTEKVMSLAFESHQHPSPSCDAEWSSLDCVPCRVAALRVLACAANTSERTCSFLASESTICHTCELLRSPNTELKQTTMACLFLASLLSGTGSALEMCCRKGLFQLVCDLFTSVVIDFLNGPAADGRDQLDTTEERLSFSVVSTLCIAMSSSKSDLVQNVQSVSSQLFPICKSVAERLTSATKLHHDKVLCRICKLLTSAVSNNCANQDRFRISGVLGALVKSLRVGAKQVNTPTDLLADIVETITAACTGNDVNKAFACGMDVIPVYCSLLAHHECIAGGALTTRLLLAILCVVEHSDTTVRSFAASGAIPLLLRTVVNCKDSDVHKAALLILDIVNRYDENADYQLATSRCDTASAGHATSTRQYPEESRGRVRAAEIMEERAVATEARATAPAVQRSMALPAAPGGPRHPSVAWTSANSHTESLHRSQSAARTSATHEVHAKHRPIHKVASSSSRCRDGEYRSRVRTVVGSDDPPAAIQKLLSKAKPIASCRHFLPPSGYASDSVRALLEGSKAGPVPAPAAVSARQSEPSTARNPGQCGLENDVGRSRSLAPTVSMIGCRGDAPPGTVPVSSDGRVLQRKKHFYDPGSLPAQRLRASSDCVVCRMSESRAVTSRSFAESPLDRSRSKLCAEHRSSKWNLEEFAAVSSCVESDASFAAAQLHRPIPFDDQLSAQCSDSSVVFEPAKLKKTKRKLLSTRHMSSCNGSTPVKSSKHTEGPTYLPMSVGSTITAYTAPSPCRSEQTPQRARRAEYHGRLNERQVTRRVRDAEGSHGSIPSTQNTDLKRHELVSVAPTASESEARVARVTRGIPRKSSGRPPDSVAVALTGASATDMRASNSCADGPVPQAAPVRSPHPCTRCPASPGDGGGGGHSAGKKPKSTARKSSTFPADLLDMSMEWRLDSRGKPEVCGLEVSGGEQDTAGTRIPQGTGKTCAEFIETSDTQAASKHRVTVTHAARSASHPQEASYGTRNRSIASPEHTSPSPDTELHRQEAAPAATQARRHRPLMSYRHDEDVLSSEYDTHLVKNSDFSHIHAFSDDLSTSTDDMEADDMEADAPHTRKKSSRAVKSDSKIYPRFAKRRRKAPASAPTSINVPAMACDRENDDLWSSLLEDESPTMPRRTRSAQKSYGRSKSVKVSRKSLRRARQLQPDLDVIPLPRTDWPDHQDKTAAQHPGAGQVLSYPSTQLQQREEGTSNGRATSKPTSNPGLRLRGKTSNGATTGSAPKHRRRVQAVTSGAENSTRVLRSRVQQSPYASESNRDEDTDHSTYGVNNASGISCRRQVPMEPWEVESLLLGVKDMGFKWTRILESFPFLERRTPADLSSKYKYELLRKQSELAATKNTTSTIPARSASRSRSKPIR